MSHNIRSIPRLSALATTISSVLGTTLLTAPAVAQDGPLEEITVTGSRIVRRDFVAPSPIMTLDSTQLTRSSTLSVESVLNRMPQFVPAGTQFVSGGQGSPTTSLGIASANLRGIGTNRTLVLIDGRRPQPANAALIVDINTIPAAAIERVETITGGASAVYGPDALAGVVNFVLKNDFEGVEMDFQRSVTSEGDGAETRFTTLIGTNSADGRGNVMLGLEWYDREVVWQRDRDFYRNGWFDPESNAGGFIHAPGISFAGPANRPTQAAVDQIFFDAHGFAPGTVNVSDPDRPIINEIYFNPDGTPFVIPGGLGYKGPLGQIEATGDGYVGVHKNKNGSLNTQFTGGMASTPQERRSLFGRATYELTDNLTAFAQVTYSNNVVTTTGGIPPAITVWQATVPVDGRSLPPALQALLDSRPDDPTADWRLFRGFDFYGEPFTTDNSNDVYQLMAGLQGEFPNSDWTWEFYAATGETDTRNDYRFLPSLQRYRALIAEPNFGVVNDKTIEREYKLDCPTGLPVFGGGPVHPRCLESVDMRGRASSKLKQDVYEFNVQGGITEMRHGELRFAAGAAYRDNYFEFQPLNDDVNSNDHPIGIFVSNNTAGDMTVKEVYGELLVPVAERLSLEFGYRYSEFNTAAGDVDTWKALFDYAATDSIRLRGGFQAATRAPNVAEMFQGPTMLTVQFAPSDPCSYTTRAPWGNVPGNPNRLQVQQLCIDLIGNPNTPFGGTPGTDAANNFARPGNPFFPLENVYEQGNENVTAESADTWTFGVVFSNFERFSGLSASVDLYSIEVTDWISPLNPVFVYQQCFNADGQSNPTYSIDDPGGYCRLINRHPITGERNIVDSPYVNQGTLKTSGVDLQVNWIRDLSEGSLFINSMVTYLNEFKLQDAPGERFIDWKGSLGQGGQFDYRMNTTIGYRFGGGNASVNLTWIHLPSVRHENKARDPSLTVLDTESYDRFNLFADYQVNDRISLRAGIDNLFDEDPPIVGSDPFHPTNPNRNAFSTNPQFYDILGRSAYVGLTMAF